MTAGRVTRYGAALVTGAASGIGRATAIALAEAGEHVIVLDRDEVRAHSVGQYICDRGGRADVLPCDLTDDRSVEQASRSLDEQNVEVELLISNAFIATGGSITDFHLPTWQKGMDVNLFGSVRLLQAFLPGMLARQRGHVVLTSSGLALLPKASAAGMLPYIAAKSALIGMAQALAFSLPPAGIDVSVFCPALTATAGHRTGLGLSEALVGTIDEAMETASQPGEAAAVLLEGIGKKSFLISSVANFREELVHLAENGLDPRAATPLLDRS